MTQDRPAPPKQAPGHVHGPGCSHGPEGHDGHAADDEMYDPNALLGRQPVIRTEPRIGRNDPCPCGSGKKYKKCHGA